MTRIELGVSIEFIIQTSIKLTKLSLASLRLKVGSIWKNVFSFLPLVDVSDIGNEA